MLNEDKFNEINKQFNSAFHNAVVEARKATDTKKKMTLEDCLLDWGFDVSRLLKNKSVPSVKTVLKFSISNFCCPVQAMIVYLKDFIDPHVLIAFIIKLYNLNYTRND